MRVTYMPYMYIQCLVPPNGSPSSNPINTPGLRDNLHLALLFTQITVDLNSWLVGDTNQKELPSKKHRKGKQKEHPQHLHSWSMHHIVSDGPCVASELPRLVTAPPTSLKLPLRHKMSILCATHCTSSAPQTALPLRHTPRFLLYVTNRASKKFSNEHFTTSRCTRYPATTDFLSPSFF